MLRSTPVALALLGVGALLPALAANQPNTSSANPGPDAGPTAAKPADPLPALTNTATRTERATDTLPVTVTTRSATQIEASGARDLKDLLRQEVDLSVRAAPARFGLASGAGGRAGNEGLNIRGLEGNQVLMLVDGIRVPASFSFGALATGRADYLGLDTAQSVDVLRGPASTAYGSDGLAGALSLRTLEPGDVLKPGQRSGGFVRLQATQLDDSVALTSAVALRRDGWQALLLLGRREGHATGNQGDNSARDSSRTAPNPTDYRQQQLLGKLLVDLDPVHQLGLTLEAVRRDTQTDVLSGRTVASASPAATAVIGLTTDDTVHRERVSVRHHYDNLDGLWLQKAQTQLYLQDARTRQYGAEDRYSSADRTRDSRYQERVLGLSTQAESQLDGAWPQRLSYGLDASRTRVSAVRDGTPNPTAAPPFGESFPSKPFPDTDYQLLGAFVQSELELAAGVPGRLMLLPGLRYDRFRLSPSGEGYSGTVVTLSDHAVTPRLGAVWQISPAWAPYAQWARGFRAPTPAQVNNGFTNLASGYRSIGNPTLRPETANSLELGLRGQAAGGRWQVAAYHNRYQDFISQEQVSGSLTVADPAVFQYVNLAQARIQGLELRGQWPLGHALQLSLAAATARGTSSRDGVRTALDTVDPARASLGLQQRVGAWQWQADLLHGWRKSASQVSTSTAFTPGAYTVLDLGVRWQARPDWTLSAQLNNATNATYWRWSDVRGVTRTSNVLDAYTAPGRHLQLALRHDF